MTVKQITSDFADRVGGDGFHDIKRASTCPGKSVWIILFLAAWIMVTWQVVTYIVKYFSYPINTLVELKFDDQAVFPAVTICNLNPVKYSKIHGKFDKDVMGLLAQSQPTQIQPQSIVNSNPDPSQPNTAPNSSAIMTSYTGRQSWTNTRTAHSEQMTGDNQRYIEEEGTYYKPPPEDVKEQASFYAYYYSLSDTDKTDIGHHIDDMLVECIWKEQQCFPDNFTRVLHPLYGNCYTFNSGFDSEDRTQRTSLMTSSMPGPSDGLVITLHIEGNEYIPLLADSSGIRIHAHSQGTPPQPGDTGFTISTGRNAALEIRRIQIIRLPLPYNQEDCSSDTYPNKEAVQAYWPFSNYSMTVCTKLCFQEHLLKKCNCIDPELLYLSSSDSAKPCNMSDTDVGFCVAQFESSFRRGNYSGVCKTACPQACTEIDFDVQISAAQWPNQYYSEILKQTASTRSDDLAERLSGDSDSEYIMNRNLLKFSVYFQSLNYKKIEEEAAYSVTDLLADLGGAVDLWVGMSVLAMIQCLEYLGMLVVYLCCTRRSPDKVNPSRSAVPSKPSGHHQRVPSKGTIYRRGTPSSDGFKAPQLF